MMKKKINVTIDLGEARIEGSLYGAINELTNLKEEFENDYIELYLEVEIYQLPYDTYQYAKVVLYGTREETDAELEDRFLREEKYKVRKEEQEKKELIRLKKLYEKSKK